MVSKVKPRKMPFDKWKAYEQEKRRIEERNLTSDEYEAAINRLCDRLGI